MTVNGVRPSAHSCARGRPCSNGRTRVTDNRETWRLLRARRAQSSGHSATGWEPGSEQVFCAEKRYFFLIYLSAMEDLLNCFKSRIRFLVSIRQVKTGSLLEVLLFYCGNFIQTSEPRQHLHATGPVAALGHSAAVRRLPGACSRALPISVCFLCFSW